MFWTASREISWNFRGKTRKNSITPLFFSKIGVIMLRVTKNLGGYIMAVKIEKTTIIGDVLDIAPHAAPLFFAIGMHCLG